MSTTLLLTGVVLQSSISSLGAKIVNEIFNLYAVALINLFTNVFLDLVETFLFFPNPAIIPGLDELWWTSLTAFIFIWLGGLLSLFLSLSFFPYDENLDPWRFIKRSIMAFAALFVSRPALSIAVEAINILGKFIYPNSYSLVLASQNWVQSMAEAFAGVAIVLPVAIALMFSVSLIPLVMLIVILALRALIVYVVYATFPIWIGAWIFDAGPMKQSNQVAGLVFKSFGMLLGIGLLMSIILSTGGALSAWTPGAESAQLAAGTMPTATMDPIPNVDPNTASAATGSMKVLAIRTIGLFGGIWASAGIVTSLLGVITSVGGGAAARSSGRMQRKAPGGGGNTTTDRGSPVGGGGGGGGGGAGGGGGGMRPGDIASGSPGGVEGVGPGQSHPSNIPGETERPFSERFGSAKGNAMSKADVKNPVTTMGAKVGRTGQSAIRKAGSVKESLNHKSASVQHKLGKLGHDHPDAPTTAGAKSAITQRFQGASNTTRRAGQKVTETISSPIIGSHKQSAEMLHEQGASFVNSNGEFNGELKGPGMVNEDGTPGPFHPDTAVAWRKYSPGDNEVFNSMPGEAYRGFRNNKDNLIIAKGDTSFAENAQLTSTARWRLEKDGGLETVSPYNSYEEDLDAIVATEKQGKTLEQIRHNPDTWDGDIDRRSYVNEVAASVMIGNERGARGDVLFDSDGKAFTPEIDQVSNTAFSNEKREQLLNKAADTELATKDEIIDKIESTQRTMQSTYKREDDSDYGIADAATRTTKAASESVKGESYDDSELHQGETGERRVALKRNMRMHNKNDEHAYDDNLSM